MERLRNERSSPVLREMIRRVYGNIEETSSSPSILASRIDLNHDYSECGVIEARWTFLSWFIPREKWQDIEAYGKNHDDHVIIRMVSKGMDPIAMRAQSRRPNDSESSRYVIQCKGEVQKDMISVVFWKEAEA